MGKVVKISKENWLKLKELLINGNGFEEKGDIKGHIVLRTINARVTYDEKDGVIRYTNTLDSIIEKHLNTLEEENKEVSTL